MERAGKAYLLAYLELNALSIRLNKQCIDSCSMQPWKPNVRVVKGLPYQARRSVLGDYPKVACGWVALLH